jgi:5-methylcytosine-specific restriction endonuclease McrA
VKRSKDLYHAKPEVQIRKKAHNSQYYKRYYRENRERELARTSLNDMRRRAIYRQTQAEPIGYKQRAEIALRQGNLCWWCGVSFGDVYHLDHVLPISKGGAHTFDNLVATCRTCNLAKGGKMPWDFAGRLF